MSWSYGDISKYIYFFSEWNSFERKKQKIIILIITLRCIFVIIIAAIRFHGFPLDLSPVVLLKLIIHLNISGVSLIYINANDC